MNKSSIPLEEMNDKMGNVPWSAPLCPRFLTHAHNCPWTRTNIVAGELRTKSFITQPTPQAAKWVVQSDVQKQANCLLIVHCN
jgi:hypothetical protein